MSRSCSDLQSIPFKVFNDWNVGDLITQINELKSKIFLKDIDNSRLSGKYIVIDKLF